MTSSVEVRGDLERAKREQTLEPLDPASMRVRRPSMIAEGVRLAPVLAQVQHWLMFIGTPRSGHSLVGALLDAHPQAAVSHEVDLAMHISAGWQTPELAAAVLDNCRRMAAIDRRWGEYSYPVPGGWAGRTEGHLRVIGDKRGGTTTAYLLQHKHLLGQIVATLSPPVRFIWMVRDPWDNIATMSRKHGIPLDQAAVSYFTAHDVNARVSKLLPDRVCVQPTERTAVDCRGLLTDLAAFVDLEPTEPWLEACAAVVRPSKRRSRDRVSWPPAVVDGVRKAIVARPMLHRYTDPAL